jgi:hypothetical protein
MSKKIEKTQLEKFKIFKERLLQDAESYNVTVETEVQHHVDLLIKAVNQAIFDLENPLPESYQKSQTHDDVKKFIAIYRQKYRLSYDLETIESITPVNGKQIQCLVEKFKEYGGTIEDYLNFLFDELLPANRKLTPGIGLSISTFAVQQYFFIRKDTFKQNKEKALEQTEVTDLLNRYRVLLRITKRSDIRMNAWFKEYEECQIDVNEFKKRIMAAEKQHLPPPNTNPSASPIVQEN